MTEHQSHLFDTQPPAWEMDEAADCLAATVLLSETPFGRFDYLVPKRLRGIVQAGLRVRVPLGQRNRLVTGYCTATANASGDTRRLKEIKGVVDDQPLLSPAMLRLTAWMADYYLCHWGQVLDAVVPAGVRGQAGT